VAAAIASPVLAKETGSTSAQKPVHALRHYRGTYNEVQGPQFVAPRVGAYGGSITDGKFDRSLPGGLDPDFTPSGS
jgi:hypothetical protein